MSLAWISLCALVVAIILSCTTKINVGILSLALAWLIGTYLGGMRLSELAAGFPTQLFLTLVGVTLLFTQAQVNGTLDRVAHHAVRSCRGNLGVIPIMFFFLALALGTIGPGSIASVALIAPMAMAVAGRAGISAFLMAIMVGNGANASSLSPFAPTGIIVNGLMAKIGLTGMEWYNYLNVMAAHTSVAFAGYFLFGGWRLFSRSYARTEQTLDSQVLGQPWSSRISRATFWKIVAPMIGGMFALQTAVILRLWMWRIDPPVPALRFYSLIATCVLIVVSVKRAHDRNKSGWFVLLLAIPVIGWVWSLVELGFLKGTEGPNRFGRDPLQVVSKDVLLKFETRHWVTLGVIAALIIGVNFFEINVGMGALAGAVILALLGVADEATAVRAMPWSPILMVTGVTVLIALLEKTGGMDLFTSFLARFSSKESVTGVTALLTGSISVFSSTSGVVLPAFLPTVPGLIEKLGAGDPFAICSSMNVGSHLVDVSPLSTTGALCIAAAPAGEDLRALFRKMLAWGLSMAIVAAVACYIVFGLFWSR